MLRLFLACAVAAVCFISCDVIFGFDTPCSTTWATSYNEEAFRALPMGSDTNEVLSRLGQPLQRRDTRVGLDWGYASEGNNINYGLYALECQEIRVIVFDSAGRVINKISKKSEPY